MYNLPTQSTSSTDVAAAPCGDMAFSPLTIIQGIHSALIENFYPQRPSVCSSVLRRPGEGIMESVQRHVTATLLEDGRSQRTDWDNSVLRPVIAEFDIVEELGLYGEDSEYIVLLVTGLSLAFELLLLVGGDKAGRARIFLARYAKSGVRST
jgi:hypothetical protein